MRRSFAILLALALLAGAAAPAQCASQATLVCETGAEDGVISLSLEELDGGAVYGVQVELKLEGEYPRCTFTPGSRTAYSPGCTAEARRGSTVVTVYLTSREALGRGKTLDLGELDLGSGGPVGWDVLPDTAHVILLDQKLRPAESDLPVTATAPSGTVRPPAEQPPVTRPSEPDEEPQLPPAAPPETPAGTPPSFADVAAGDWFYGAVGYVSARAIMSGTEAGLFSPYQNTTRGMTVTMLHRLEDTPAALPASFQDVPAGAYYAGAVAWASASGIVTGSGDGLFSPEAPVTREQLAAILYRFARYKGLSTAAQADLGRFSDADRVSPYALEAMRWAVGTGLIAGSDGALDPAGLANRAQVATIFQRLCANLLGMV